LSVAWVMGNGTLIAYDGIGARSSASPRTNRENVFIGHPFM
jgi:hypothetical protein